VSAATKVSPFEFAYGFPPRVPLTAGLTSTGNEHKDKGATALARRIRVRHQAASDSMAAAQVRLGKLLHK